MSIAARISLISSNLRGAALARFAGGTSCPRSTDEDVGRHTKALAQRLRQRPDMAQANGPLPLLSDTGSKVIDAMASATMRQPAVASACPHPVVFILDQQGAIRAKLMRDSYRERPESAEINHRRVALQRRPRPSKVVDQADKSTGPANSVEGIRLRVPLSSNFASNRTVSSDSPFIGKKPMQSALNGIRACVFDAYGTLFDFASAALHCESELGASVKPLTALWRDKQLQYTWLRTLQNRHADFWQVTGDALDNAMETLGIASPALRARLMNLYLSLEPFPEVPAVLRELKARGLVTAILSNGTPHMLSTAVETAALKPLIDVVLSIEEVGVYKPHSAVYQLAGDRLGIPANAIAFQSSNAWDAYAASAFGMRAVWCNRHGQKSERLPGKPDAVIQSLTELPALLRANTR